MACKKSPLSGLFLGVYGIVSLCFLGSDPLFAFVEQDLEAPASELTQKWQDENREKEPQEGGRLDQEKTFLNTAPLDFNPTLTWPAPQFGMTLLLSQNDYSSLAYLGFAFSDYMQILFGWILDAESLAIGQRLTHGPMSAAHFRLPNPSVLTPVAYAGPAYFFSKRAGVLDSQKTVRSLGILGGAGFELLMTRHFSLLVQQSFLVMEAGLLEESGEEKRLVSRSQIMFQFTF